MIIATFSKVELLDTPPGILNLYIYCTFHHLKSLKTKLKLTPLKSYFVSTGVLLQIVFNKLVACHTDLFVFTWDKYADQGCCSEV